MLWFIYARQIVWLDGIDAPELAQSYGQKLKQALSAMAFGKTARIESDGTGKYGRTLGMAYGTVVNKVLAKQSRTRRYL